MQTYTVEVITKRLLKVTAKDRQEAIAKAYQMLMQFEQAGVQSVPGLTMIIGLKDEMP